MAITLRKPGTIPAKVLPIVSPSSADEVYQSPFRESFHEAQATPSAQKSLPEASLPLSPSVPLTTPAPLSKPKAIFKITGGKPIRPGLPAPSPSPAAPLDLAAAGLLDSGELASRELTSRELYPVVSPGDFITITNNLFPWVKHYQPGDIARVMYSSTTHSHPEDPIKYRAHFVEVMEGPRKGCKAMLFRWEFEPRPVGCQKLPKIEGRVITQS